MGDLEEEISVKGREFQRRVLQEAGQRKADNCPMRCPICKEPLSRVSRGHECTVDSRFGAIRIVRSYGYCRECKQWFYPGGLVASGRGRLGRSNAVQTSRQFWSTAGDEALLALETFWRNGRWYQLFPHAGAVLSCKKRRCALQNILLQSQTQSRLYQSHYPQMMSEKVPRRTLQKRRPKEMLSSGL